MPSNGATMRRRAAVARASASLACDTCRFAALSSTDRWLMKPCATSSWLRLWLAWAIDSSAWACCSCARGSWSSSCTSSWPRRTRSPSRKLSCVTRPLTSGRSTTLCRERRLPTAWASSVSLDHLHPRHFDGGRTRRPARLARGCARLAVLGPGRGGLVLVPPGQARGGRDANGCDDGVDCFRCHEISWDGRAESRNWLLPRANLPM